jgi:phospholipid/cholesterol/gamma-HCH transport system substrate-binding protein
VQDTFYDKVLPNSVLELTSSPIGLGVTLNFHPGATSGPPRPEFSFIPSLDLPEGQDLVSAGLVVIPKGEDVIGSVIGKINPILDDVRTTLVQIKPVGGMVMDLSRTPDKLNALIDDTNARIDDISRQANAAIGSFGTVAATAQGTVDSLSADLGEIAANIKTTTDGLTETRGLVTRLLDPKGSVATILNDQNALYDQIEGSLKQVQDAVTGLNRIVAQVNAFVDYLNGTRPQISDILETGRTTLEKGNDVLEAVKNNPLLRGGVPESKQQTTTLKSYRDEDF